jgi:hypothetical protein
MIRHNFTDLKNVSGIQTFVASVIVRYLILSAQAKTIFIRGFLDIARKVVTLENRILAYRPHTKSSRFVMAISFASKESLKEQ